MVVASGPSLTEDQCALITERRAADACRVIVINDNYKRVPNADVLFAADRPWWKLHSAAIAAACPKIERWSCEPTTRDYGTLIWPASSGRGIYPEGEYPVRRNSSSTHMAAQLGMKWGSRHIVLVGVDCKKGRDGKNHWFGDHPAKLLPSQQPFVTWAEEWDHMVLPAKLRGIDLVNCSPDTAIKTMRRSTLERELFAPEEQAQGARPDDRVHPHQPEQDDERDAA